MELFPETQSKYFLSGFGATSSLTCFPHVLPLGLPNWAGAHAYVRALLLADSQYSKRWRRVVSLAGELRMGTRPE